MHPDHRSDNGVVQRPQHHRRNILTNFLANRNKSVHGAVVQFIVAGNGPPSVTLAFAGVQIQVWPIGPNPLIGNRPLPGLRRADAPTSRDGLRRNDEGLTEPLRCVAASGQAQL